MNDQAEKVETEVDDQPTAEEQAAAKGWKPESEWDGPEGQWRTAEEFLEFGRKFDQSLKSKNRNLERELAELRETVSQFQPFMDSAIEKSKRERDEAIAELKALRRKAIEEGDGAAFDKAEDDLKKVQSKPAPQSPQDAAVAKAEQAFIDRNKEWLDNPELRDTAEAFAVVLNKNLNGMGPVEFYAELERRVKTAYPEHFAAEKPRAASVEGTKRSRTKQSKHTFEDLPPEAQAACRRFEKSIPGFKAEDYLKNYEWES